MQLASARRDLAKEEEEEEEEQGMSEMENRS